MAPISGINPASGTLDGSAGARRLQRLAVTAANDSRDRVELSGPGRDLSRAEQAVEQAADLRFEVVNALRAAVKAGDYKVDARAVAAAMVKRGEES